MFENLKNEWNKQDDEGRVIMVVLAAAVLLVALLLVGLAWLIVKSMLPYLLVGAVVYGLGVWKFNFPVPKFLKKYL